MEYWNQAINWTIPHTQTQTNTHTKYVVHVHNIMMVTSPEQNSVQKLDQNTNALKRSLAEIIRFPFLTFHTFPSAHQCMNYINFNKTPPFPPLPKPINKTSINYTIACQFCQHLPLQAENEANFTRQGYPYASSLHKHVIYSKWTFPKPPLLCKATRCNSGIS